jgi:hypothetical protein
MCIVQAHKIPRFLAKTLSRINDVVCNHLWDFRRFSCGGESPKSQKTENLSNFNKTIENKGGNDKK